MSIYHLLYAQTADGGECTTKLVSKEALADSSGPQDWFLSKWTEIEDRGMFNLKPVSVKAENNAHLLPEAFEESNG